MLCEFQALCNKPRLTQCRQCDGAACLSCLYREGGGARHLHISQERQTSELEKQTFEGKQMRNNIENSHKYVVLLQHFPAFSSQNASPLYKMGSTQKPLPCSPNMFTSESRVKDYLHATAFLKYSFFFVPTHLVTCFNINIPVPITEVH